jgi:hypothetical protein
VHEIEDQSFPGGCALPVDFPVDDLEQTVRDEVGADRNLVTMAPNPAKNAMRIPSP